MQDVEIWRPVVGYEGAYEVSSLGRVRSLDRMIQCRAWDKYAKVHVPTLKRAKGRVLRPGLSSGHLTVALGKDNSRLVHHLVLEAFVGPRPEGCESLHADDVGDNNVLGNLSWGTRSQNLHDAVRNGRKQHGDRHRYAKMTDQQASAVKGLHGVRRPCDLARKLGVNEATIRQLWSGRSWKSVPKMNSEEAMAVIYA